MTRINSREKGKRGEREAVKFLESLGFTAERTAQHCGKGGMADVVVKELPNVHIEVKCGVQGMDINTKLLQDARAQADRDCPKGKCAVVLWKPLNKKWRLDSSHGCWCTFDQTVIDFQLHKLQILYSHHSGSAA